MLRFASLLCLGTLSLSAVEYTLPEVTAALHGELPFMRTQMPYYLEGTVASAPEGQRFLTVKALVSAEQWSKEDSTLRFKDGDMALTSAAGEPVQFIGTLDKFGRLIPSGRLSVWISKPHNGETTSAQYVQLVALVDEAFQTGTLQIGEANAEISISQSAVPPTLPIQAEITEVAIRPTLSIDERQLKDVALTLTPAAGHILQLKVTWTITGHIDAKAAGPGIWANWDSGDIAVRLENGLVVPAIASQYYPSDRGLGVRIGKESMSVSQPHVDESQATFDYFFIIPKGVKQAELLFAHQASGNIQIAE